MRTKSKLMLLGAITAMMLASPAAAQRGGGGMGGGGMGGGGGGHMPHPDGPPADDGPHVERNPEQVFISLEKFDKAVTEMFKSADLNHDGMVTLAELQSVIEQRRDAIIRDRFRDIDTNHDGHIDLAEFTAWQADMGAVATSQCAGYAGQAELVPESFGPQLGNGPKDQALNVAIEPFSATMLTRANTHYRAGATLEDVLAYENARFNGADTNRDGFLDWQEIAALRGKGNGRPRN